MLEANSLAGNYTMQTHLKDELNIYPNMTMLTYKANGSNYTDTPDYLLNSTMQSFRLEIIVFIVIIIWILSTVAIVIYISKYQSFAKKNIMANKESMYKLTNYNIEYKISEETGMISHLHMSKEKPVISLNYGAGPTGSILRYVSDYFHTGAPPHDQLAIGSEDDDEMAAYLGDEMNLEHLNQQQKHQQQHQHQQDSNITTPPSSQASYYQAPCKLTTKISGAKCGKGGSGALIKAKESERKRREEEKKKRGSVVQAVLTGLFKTPKMKDKIWRNSTLNNEPLNISNGCNDKIYDNAINKLE